MKTKNSSARLISKKKAKVTFFYENRIILVCYTLGEFEVVAISRCTDKSTGYAYFNTLKEALIYGKKQKFKK